MVNKLKLVYLFWFFNNFLDAINIYMIFTTTKFSMFSEII